MWRGSVWGQGQGQGLPRGGGQGVQEKKRRGEGLEAGGELEEVSSYAVKTI